MRPDPTYVHGRKLHAQKRPSLRCLAYLERFQKQFSAMREMADPPRRKARHACRRSRLVVHAASVAREKAVIVGRAEHTPGGYGR